MDRKIFVTSIAFAAAAPLTFLKKSKVWVERATKGFKIGEAEGRKHGPIQLKGVNSNVLRVKISGSDTNGDLAIFEQTSLSQGRGTPLHVHPSQDEIFYVIEGAYQFLVGDQKFKLTVGDSIFLPRAVPHAWTQASEKGKMLVTMQPEGKLEDFFVAMAALERDPTPADVARIFEENDMKMVGPPLKLE